MHSEIEKYIEDLLKIRTIKEYQFREVCGFTFAFKKEAILINNQFSSGEIKPIAIIYEENGEYLLAPLDVVDEINEVVKQFVQKQLQ